MWDDKILILNIHDENSYNYDVVLHNIYERFAKHDGDIFMGRIIEDLID